MPNCAMVKQQERATSSRFNIGIALHGKAACSKTHGFLIHFDAFGAPQWGIHRD
jgi:hypothetical protein